MVQGSAQLISYSCPSGCRANFVRRGHYVRKSDGICVQRFKCHLCKASFSESTFGECYRQKKRHLNAWIFRLLCGGFSQRRAAFDIGVNRKTIVRKFCLMGQMATQALVQYNQGMPKVKCMEFDDLETFLHTKCKPLSVTLAVENGSRRILGFRVSDMPAKGKLAKIAFKKYGPRKDERGKARKALFTEIKDFVAPGAQIKSDQNPHYPSDVAKYFPGSEHKTFKSRRACVVGQGELKRGGFDPLFSLNHTCAMLRANINRLVRRSWCTTKRKERLAYHIAIYACYHNLLLI